MPYLFQFKEPKEMQFKECLKKSNYLQFCDRLVTYAPSAEGESLFALVYVFLDDECGSKANRGWQLDQQLPTK